MKFLGSFFIFCSVFVFANNERYFINLQDTLVEHHIVSKDSLTHQTNTTIQDSTSKTNTDSIPKKIYRKKIIVPIQIDSVLQDSLIKDSINKILLLADSLKNDIDTAAILSSLTIYHLIPFYLNPQDSSTETDRYAGEKRVQNNESFDIYIYAYLFLFFLAICINVLQALSSKKYNKNTTFKADIRRFSNLGNYYHWIIFVVEFLISVGFAIFLNLCIQVFSATNLDLAEAKNFIIHTTIACFLFFIAKHFITSIVQNLFLSKQDCFIILYFYKNMLIHLTSLLYMATAITFFIKDPSSKIYFVEISIALGILIYLYGIFNVLRNIRKTLFLPSLIGFLVYMITIEIIPYLLFFKLLYTHHFFNQP